MADEVEIKWELVQCGTDKVDLWTGRLVRPFLSVHFVKVGMRLDGDYILWFCPKGIGIDLPYSIHRYGTDRGKPMAQVERWARTHWRSIPRA